MFGASGQVAREVAALAAARGDFSMIALDRAAADFSNPKACAQAVRAHAADAVLIAAAFTGVDAAESARETAFQINAATPGAIAAAAADAGIPLVHLSSDYVFDGRLDRPYREDDTPRPLNVYGASKLAGEEAVMAAHKRAAVLRTSWVFAPHGRNFVGTVIRLARGGKALRIVEDQIGGPTPARDVARVSVALAGALASGTADGGLYQFQGSPAASWADFAAAILAALQASGMAVPPLQRIATRDFPTPAARPLNTLLDCSRIGALLHLTQPDWRPQVGPAVAALEKD